MPPAPRAKDEEQRQQALDALKILDTPPDPRLDGLVRLAADLFETPIALVTMLDRDRQWFKARVGADMSETSRNLSFCDYAAQTPSEVMVVPDTTADPRFADNPVVLGDPKIRAYAGAPICAPGGAVVGTLCVLDQKPRLFTAAMTRRLADLAYCATTAVELHRTTVDLMRVSMQDAATGLANRTRFDASLLAAVNAATPSQPCALLIADLDGFKGVNDTFGHQVGDALLRAVSARLAAAVRTSDVVARIGGDEFAVVLVAPATAQIASIVCERILESMRAPFHLGGAEVYVGISVGTALCPRDTTDPAGLVAIADAAMYAFKRAGRITFNPDYQRREPSRRQTENAVR